MSFTGVYSTILILQWESHYLKSMPKRLSILTEVTQLQVAWIS
ncbi:hypothetical protein PALB_10000 [Pseudoalteromonas luteoviolacea B = ATCC 29581]|nr:hypothetical protein PALB_10000 [Pseudoalteromonas luteoviolacea B = ATCC 29581]